MFNDNNKHDAFTETPIVIEKIAFFQKCYDHYKDKAFTEGVSEWLEWCAGRIDQLHKLLATRTCPST